MTVLSPPPLPANDLPPEPEASPAASPAAAPGRAEFGVSLVFFYLLCSGLPVLAATMYVWNRGLGGGGLFAGGFFYMLGVLFVYLLALLAGILNCWHCIGGFVAACAFACRGRISRTAWCVMGPGYGLLSALLLLDAANASIGPRVQPLGWPIPVNVATWIVPAAGVLLAAGVWWSDRQNAPPSPA